MNYPRNSSRAKLARFNWYVLLACALLFATGGTLAGVAAIILSGTQGVTFLAYVVAIVMSVGLYLAAGCALHSMERC